MQKKLPTYRVEVFIQERSDCEPFRSPEDVGLFVYGKLIEGTVVDVSLITVRKDER